MKIYHFVKDTCTGDPDKRPIDFTQFRVLPKERATVGVGELPSEERLRQNRQIDAHLGD